MKLREMAVYEIRGILINAYVRLIVNVLKQVKRDFWFEDSV